MSSVRQSVLAEQQPNHALEEAYGLQTVCLRALWSSFSTEGRSEEAPRDPARRPQRVASTADWFDSRAEFPAQWKSTDDAVKPRQGCD